MKQGNKGVIKFKKGSKIYILIDHNKYKHVKGKSIDTVLLDEYK